MSTEIVNEDRNTQALIARAEIDQQIATAHAFPRSLALFKSEAMSMATLDEETAASCFYSLPRGGKPIEGPSVRLAEIVASAWGNLRYGARIVEVTKTQVVAEGMCHDLQRNNAAKVEVRRRITNKRGERYNDDMINVTANAACSIALRNAIYKVVPMAYTKEVYLSARKVAIGDASTLSARRARMVDHFGKMGVTPERILWLLERPALDDIGLDDIGKLIGLATAIKEGDTTVDEAFPARDPNTPEPEKPKSKAEAKASAKSDKPTEPPESTPDAKPEPETTQDTPEAEEGSQREPKVANGNTKVFVRMLGTKRHEARARDMTDGDLTDAMDAAQAALADPDITPGEDKYYESVVDVLQAEQAKRSK